MDETETLVSYEEKLARKVVENWLWDCGKGNQTLGFVQSELLQQRIVEAIRVARHAITTP